MQTIPLTRITSQEVKRRFETLNNYQNNEKMFFEHSTAFLRFIQDKSLLLKILREILAEEDYLKEVALNSYRHVNHFSKIVLINDLNQEHCRLTLHIWKPPFTDDEINQELIHDHRFSFSSCVLCGEQIHEIFKESPKNSITKVRFQKYKYLPSETSNIHKCFFEKYVALDQVSEKVVNHGGIYTMQNESIHRILFPTGDEPIISFMVRGPRKRNFTHTYNTFYPCDDTVSNVPMYSKSELKELLIYTLHKI